MATEFDTEFSNENPGNKDKRIEKKYSIKMADKKDFSKAIIEFVEQNIEIEKNTHKIIQEIDRCKILSLDNEINDLECQIDKLAITYCSNEMFLNVLCEEYFQQNKQAVLLS